MGYCHLTGCNNLILKQPPNGFIDNTLKQITLLASGKAFIEIVQFLVGSKYYWMLLK